MNPSQPDSESRCWQDFLAYRRSWPQFGCEPEPQADWWRQALAGLYANPTGSIAQAASAQAAPAGHVAQRAGQQAQVPHPQVAAPAQLVHHQQRGQRAVVYLQQSGQQAGVYPQQLPVAAAAGGYHLQPQPQVAARNFPPAQVQQPLLRVPIVPSQAPPARVPVPARYYLVRVPQGYAVMQGPTQYAPPPPHSMSPPTRTQSASPWNQLFSPLSAASTAATTPGSSVARRTVPLPAEGQFAGAPAKNAQVAYPATGAAPARTPKRRIAEVDAGAGVARPSKRPATEAAVQARSAETATSGHHVQSNKETISMQRAPPAPAPGPWAALEATVPGATGGPHGDSALDEDDGSLFGDAEDDGEPASALGLSLGPPRPAEDNGGPGTAAQALPAGAAKHAAPPSQLVLPGMDTHEGPTRAPATFALCLPGTDSALQGRTARTGPPTWTRLAHSAPSVSTSSAAAPRAAQPPLAAGGSASEKPRTKKKASGSSTGTGTSSAGSSSRKQRQTQTKAPGPPALSKQSRAPDAAQNATPDHVMRMYNLKSYAWMTSGAGSNPAR